MLSAQRLKKEVQFKRELMDLLGVMKGIAASQFLQALEARKKRFLKFILTFDEFFRDIDFSNIFNPFIEPKTEKMGIIMLTSDEGFMGGLNVQVINMALAQEGANTAEIIIVGERGTTYLRALGRNFKAFKGFETAEERYSVAVELRNYIRERVKQGKLGRIILVYPKAISFMVQRVEILKILPITEMFEKREETIQDKGRLGEGMIIESSLEGIMEYLIEAWWLERLLEALEESRLSEFAARVIHLETSCQRLSRQQKHLRFQYFRIYHETIDKSMRESFSAQIIRKRSINGRC